MRAAILLAAAAVAYNNVANRWPPFHADAYVAVNVVFAGVVVGVGAWVLDIDRAAMGLVWRAPWIGLAVAVAAACVVMVLLALERGRALLRDERLREVRGARAVYTVAIRIPIGTALVEEVVFRGVLLGSMLGEGTARALGVSSIAFGLWHVVPTMDLARANRLGWWVVPAGVVATGAAGALLGWLRIETGSIATPLIAHASINAAGAAGAIAAFARARRPGAQA